jgi:hypothetical protein
MLNVSIITWGTSFKSALGMPRLSKLLRNMYSLTPFHRGLIVGLLLSDAAVMRGQAPTSNWRIYFEQSFSRNFQYFMQVYFILTPFIRSLPILRIRPARAGTKFNATTSLTLTTIALPCITELAQKFFLPGTNTKIIPADIYNLLSPVALAHWIIGDGEAKKSGLRLCTDSYTLQEVVRLMNVLIVRYGIVCRIHVKRANHYRIFIPESQIDKLRSIVMQHMISTMYYKVGIRFKGPRE